LDVDEVWRTEKFEEALILLETVTPSTSASIAGLSAEAITALDETAAKERWRTFDATMPATLGHLLSGGHRKYRTFASVYASGADFGVEP
jgi:hypothetical protein